jgi:hypothetical protein
MFDTVQAADEGAEHTGPPEGNPMPSSLVRSPSMRPTASRAARALNRAARRFNVLSTRLGGLASFIISVFAAIVSVIAFLVSKTDEENISALTKSESAIGLVGATVSRGQLIGQIAHTLIVINSGTRNAAVTDASFTIAQLRADDQDARNCETKGEHLIYAQYIRYSSFEPFVVKANEVVIKQFAFKAPKPGEGSERFHYSINYAYLTIP